MLNKSTSRSEYTVQSGVTQYPVGFVFYYNGDDTPQIRVTIGAMVAEENVHFVISEDLLTINLIPLEEEAPVDPNDYSWMDKWVGMQLVIERDIPLVQESDYHLGRISPERIERDFDLSVMRDQMLVGTVKELRGDMDKESIATNARLDSVQKQVENINAYTKDELDAKLSSVYKFKGSVATVDALPSDADVGDTYNVEDTGANYSWDGTNWDKLSDTIDLSKYATKEYVDDNTFTIMDYVDEQISPLVADSKKLYNNQLIIRDMLNEKDENDEFIKPTTEAQTAITAINELNEKKASKEDLSGYLPLDGGTVTGPLALEDKLSFGPWNFTYLNNYDALAVSHGSAGRWLTLDYKQGAIYPLTVDLDLGTSVCKWNSVYTRKLNNGADLILPTEGGTLARLEDIQNAGGGGGGGDYLPLTGGTITGDVSIDGKLYIEAGLIRYSINGIEIHPTGETVFGYSLSTVSLRPKKSDYSSLGNSSRFWTNVYTRSLNNGADLILPTEGGTLARMEDMQNLDCLPDQSGNAGKVLTTDGTTASWQEAPAGGTKVIIKRYE